MRLPSIDLLRILTVGLIVHRHTYGSSDALIFSVGVPFFFFLTGWLWRPGRRVFPEEVRHRWRTLGVPYVSWLVLLYPLFVAAFAVQNELTWQRAVSPLLGGSYVGAAYTTFWFISALFAVGIMMRLLDNVSTGVRVGMAAGLLAVGGAAGEALAWVPLGLGVAVPSLAFAIIGCLLHEWSAHQRVRWAAVLILPAAGAATIPFDPINIKYGDFGTFIVSSVLSCLIIWGLLVVLDAVFRRVPSTAVRVSAWLGPFTSVAIVVVLVHPLVLWVLAFARQTPTPAAWEYMVALVLPWVVALVLKRTRLSPLLVGQPLKAGPVTPRGQRDVPAARHSRPGVRGPAR